MVPPAEAGPNPLRFGSMEWPAAATPWASSATDATVLASGDIGDCIGNGEYETATIIDGYPGATVAALGDLAYYAGTPDEFQSCYEPNWGRHKAQTRPTPGNHEYGTAGASGYFGYFGANAGPVGKGWYSYDLGSWHVVVLNSNCDPGGIDCRPGGEQLEWLRADLAAHPADCTLAYFHHPLHTSGQHNGDANLQHVRPFWDALFEHGAELILNGHDHDYERFTPMTPGGVRDTAYGIRQFVVGTGGATLRGLKVPRPPTSENFYSGTHGILKLVLRDGGYAWEFLGEPGTSFTDSGANNCHGAPDSSPPGAPQVTSSHTSAWSNDNTVDVAWSGASDSGSGVDGYSLTWTQAADSVPDTVKDVEENVGTATSPPLADGDWWFHLRTGDNAGNWSGPVHLGPFRIDRAVPANAALGSPSHIPGAWSNDPTVELAWSGATDAHSGVDGFSYAWTPQAATLPDDAKDAEETAASTTSPTLADGDWWFHLRTRDNAGNWSSAVHIGPFRIDTVAPTNPTVTSPSHDIGSWSNKPSVVVRWDGGAGESYSVEWSASESTEPDAVAEGTATQSESVRPDGASWFHLRTRTEAGAWSHASHIGPFLIDTAPPETLIDSHAGTRFTFVSEPSATFECSLDDGPFAGCASPATYPGLAPGAHVFRVRALDPARNADPTPAELRWTIEAAPPPPPPPPSPPPPPPPPADPPPKRPPLEAKQCVVPRLAGRTIRYARRLITRAGCRVGRVRAAYSPRVDKGRVISQSPGGRRRVARGTRVNVVVSLGRKPVPRRR